MSPPARGRWWTIYSRESHELVQALDRRFDALEQGRADAHQCRTLGDGDLEVPGHAHGQFGELTVWRGGGLETVPQLAQARKGRPRVFRVGIVGRHGHEATDA